MLKKNPLSHRLAWFSLVMMTSVFLAAFKMGDLAELETYLNDSAQAQFPRSTQNVQMVVSKGTEGAVKTIKRFASGAFAVELEVQGGAMANQHSGQRLWLLVRSTDRANAVQLFRFDEKGRKENVDDLDDAKRVVVLRDLPGIARLVNPKSQSVAASAQAGGPPVSVMDLPEENEKKQVEYDLERTYRGRAPTRGIAGERF